MGASKKARDATTVTAMAEMGVTRTAESKQSLAMRAATPSGRSPSARSMCPAPMESMSQITERPVMTGTADQETDAAQLASLKRAGTAIS